MNRKNYIIVIAVSVVIVALILLVVYLLNKTKEKENEIAQVVEMMQFEKDQVEREFRDMATEFDGYTSNIKNDSLFKLLENQKVKMHQLLEELRVTKATNVTNARRIAELKRELASVRKLLRHYVIQIDSLNAENKVLRTENTEVKRRYTAASETVDKLSKEKDNLSEVVTRASKLEVTGFSFTQLNSRNKRTTRLSQTSNLQFNFTVAKNITAHPGNKTMYLRLTRPDDELMVKKTGQVFNFENKTIAYSLKKDFEYTGEAHSDVLYWQVEEVIQPGTYRADFFCDEHRVGSFTFEVKK